EDPDTPPIRYMARSEAKQLHATLTPLAEEIEASNPTIQTSLNNLQKQENQRAIKRAETHVEKLVQQGKIPTNQKQAAIQHFTQKARKQVTIHDLPKEARLHPCPIHETANQYLDGH